MHVSAGPLDRAVDRSMRSVYDEQPHVGPADDLEVRLSVREAPGIVAGRKELPEPVVGLHLQSEYPPHGRLNLSRRSNACCAAASPAV